MISPALLHKQGFKYFVREAFRQLHPNHPPLQLTWYMQAMCHALEQTSSGACRRLVINVPPRHGKSITAAVAFCAWILGQDPAAKILVGTYNEDLARLHDRQLKLIMESVEYRAAFPATMIDRKTTRQLELRTTAGGFRMAVTTGGSATGFGGDYIILDDCMKAQDAGSEAERIRVRDWYRGTIGTRLDNKGEGVIISIQQRLHEDDLTSLIIEAGATHLNLPAIAQRSERIPTGPNSFHERQPGDLLNPERENLQTLNELRRELGSAVFGPQWLQDPTPAEGNIVRLEWFSRYDAVPERHRFLKVVQSWDTAFSAEPGSAFSVCTTWGYFEGRWYLLNVMRERLEYYDLKRRVVSLHRKWKPDRVLIEKASSGEALLQDLRAEGPFRPTLWRVTGSKEDRLRAQTGQMEAGKIVLPQEAAWLETYLHELKGAPSCRYWDQVDSTTQFLDYTQTRQGWIDQDVDPVSGRKMTIKRRQSINRR